MKNKGFTLIELLGVIIILALLMLLVFPSIINSIKKTSDEVDDLTLDLIYNASDIYIENHIDNFPKVNGNKYVIELNDLIAEDLITSSIKTSKGENIENKKCVQVTYDNKFTYELKDSGTCEEIIVVCRAKEEATTGNVPEGNYNPGDEYLCEVKPGVSYTFFVISSDTYTNNVNLLMYANINDDGVPVDSDDMENKGTTYWISEKDYNDITTERSDEVKSKDWCSIYGFCEDTKLGPLTAMDYLYKATKDWSNIPNVQMNYNDDGGNYGSIITNNKVTVIKKGTTIYRAYENLRASLPIFNSSLGTLCSGTNAPCPLWAINNVHNNIDIYSEMTHIEGVYGYWLLGSASSQISNAQVITMNGIATTEGINFGWNESDESYFDSMHFGVRPVITLPKTSLKQ
ncbi:MAG: prepilin-type N-terminal cleavage/methylation domain-containing protein [Bacilli bacterium]|nr:prepilin-type N-terminal cleavage/methylation domain-containing protein [Bacilli bacterium]